MAKFKVHISAQGLQHPDARNLLGDLERSSGLERGVEVSIRIKVRLLCGLNNAQRIKAAADRNKALVPIDFELPIGLSQPLDNVDFAIGC